MSPYVTADGVPTHEMVLQDLELHMLAVHSVSTQGSKVKTAPLKCPNIGEGVTEGELISFVPQWDHYKRRTELAGQPTIDELWVVMDSPLERLTETESDGLRKCTTEEELKERINILAVKGQNLLVNRVPFLVLSRI